MLWIKIAIVIILIITIIFWSLISAFDKLMTRSIIKTLKKQREDYPDQPYLSLDEIIAREKPSQSLGWFARWINRNWILSKRHVRRRCHNAIVISESEEKKDYFGFIGRNLKIDALFRWDDNTVYEWEVTKEKTSILKGIVLAAGTWMIQIGMFYIPLCLLEWLTPWISAAVAVFLLYDIVKSEIERHNWKKDEVEYRENIIFKLTTDMKSKNLLTLGMGGFVTGLFLYFISCPILPFEGLFANYSNDKLAWVLFATQNVLDALFLNITEILNIHLTSIEANTLMGRILAAILNFSIVYSGVSIMISQYKMHTERSFTFSGTVKECFLWLLGEMRLDNDHQLICKGKLIELENRTVLKSGEFSSAFFEDFDRESSEIYPFA